MSFAVNQQYIQPITSAGVAVDPSAESTWATGRGVYTLTAGATYFFVLPIGGASMADIHLTHDAAIAITSAEIETCGHGRSDVSDYSAIGGEWMTQNPSTAYVAVEGATTTATAAVVAVVAGNAGGADWQISGAAAPRMRLEVVVGGTGGEVRLSFTGKD